MGQTPDELRREIEDTRASMSDTVEAIGYRADVPGRAKEKVVGVKDRVAGAITGAKEKVTGAGQSAASSVSDATPSREEVAQQARRAAGIAQENPLGLAVGSLAAGFLLGLVVPSTRVEQERIGPIADQVKDKAREAGQEALERGKQVAQQTAETAKQATQEMAPLVQDAVKEVAQQTKETAQQQAQEQAEELKSSAQEKASELSSSS